MIKIFLESNEEKRKLVKGLFGNLSILFPVFFLYMDNPYSLWILFLLNLSCLFGLYQIFILVTLPKEKFETSIGDVIQNIVYFAVFGWFAIMNIDRVLFVLNDLVLNKLAFYEKGSTLSYLTVNLIFIIIYAYAFYTGRLIENQNSK